MAAKISGTPAKRQLTKTSLNLPVSSSQSGGDQSPSAPRARDIIQKELFSTERLVSCVSVGKAKDVKKKKQPTFFCVTVTSEKPVICKIHIIKKADKGDGYKRKSTWELSDLKSVDGKVQAGQGSEGVSAAAEFDVTLEKLYKWRADSVTEKDDLIQVLWKLSKRYLKDAEPKFINAGKSISDVSVPSAHDDKLESEDDTKLDPLSDLAYQVISKKEENDITQLMLDSEIAISDAHRFADKLTTDLSMLDGANVHSIVSSEDHVLQLMQLIDEAIKEVTQIEDRLSSYDQVIMVVKEEMRRMKEKDDLMKVQEANHEQLITSLDTLVGSLNLPHRHQKALLSADLSTSEGVRDCTEAAQALQECMQADIETGLLSMDAVKVQKSKFIRFSSKFSKRLAHHLNNLFLHKEDDGAKINTMQGTLRAGELRITSHTAQHRALLPYTDLMLWLKHADPSGFLQLQTVYSQSLQKIYEREIGAFLEAVKLRVGHKDSKHGSSLTIKHSAGSTESLQSIDPRQQTADKQSRQAFDKMIEKTFSELSPICVAEQDFCTQFFHINQTNEGDAVDKAADNETRLLLADIFSSLDRDLLNFISYCVKQDTFYSLSLLVHLSHHTKSVKSAYLSKVYGTASITVKRSFDDYIKGLCKTWEETKPTKKTRCGIVSIVHSFEAFAEESENIFHNSDRRSDLDKAYKVLAQCMFYEVGRVASEHLKTPRHVIMLENFHRINAVLSRMKITCLDAEKKDAKLRYQEHTQAYVQEQLGRPMEKLTLFFEGVDEKLKSGVKAEEVGYLLAFNKQELRKVIKEYPAKEVRKGLEALYKKMEKQMCDEENLLQVVWNSMQKEFLNQYNLFVNMLGKCYAASNIALEFSIEDILDMFSDIARTHI